MRIPLGPASAQDFEYGNRLYFAGMKKIIEELNLVRAAQAVPFRENWEATQVRIIGVGSSDVGWLQSTIAR